MKPLVPFIVALLTVSGAAVADPAGREHGRSGKRADDA